MLLDIPDVLTGRTRSARVPHRAGRRATGWMAASPPATRRRRSSDNRSCPRTTRVARRLGDAILRRAGAHPLFISAALPLQGVSRRCSTATPAGRPSAPTSTPRSGQVPGTPHRVRTDLSATLFLTDARRLRRRRTGDRGHLRRARGEAAGRAHGALSGEQPASRAPGHARRAARRRSSGSRAWCATTARARMLFDLDTAIQHLAAALPEHPARRAAHRRLPQPAAPLGGVLMRRAAAPSHRWLGLLLSLPLLVQGLTGAILTLAPMLAGTRRPHDRPGAASPAAISRPPGRWRRRACGPTRYLRPPGRGTGAGAARARTRRAAPASSSPRSGRPHPARPGRAGRRPVDWLRRLHTNC